MTDASIGPPPSTPPDDGSRTTASTAQRAKDEAAAIATTAKDETSAVAQTAVDEAKHLGSEAGQQVQEVVADVRQQLRAKADEESRRLAQSVGDVGQQLRTMAAAGDAGIARDLVTQVAQSAEQIAQRLEQGGLDRTLDDARRLARNRPGTFLMGAAAAGFIAARVARSVDTTAVKEAATPSPPIGEADPSTSIDLTSATYDPATAAAMPIAEPVR
jgi:hypothetical protein